MTIEREQIEILIRTSTSVEQADQYIEKYCDFKTTREKIAFLEGMGAKVYFRESGTVEDDYLALLHTIINH